MNRLTLRHGTKRGVARVMGEPINGAPDDLREGDFVAGVCQEPGAKSPVGMATDRARRAPDYIFGVTKVIQRQILGIAWRSAALQNAIRSGRIRLLGEGECARDRFECCLVRDGRMNGKVLRRW